MKIYTFYRYFPPEASLFNKNNHYSWIPTIYAVTHCIDIYANISGTCIFHTNIYPINVQNIIYFFTNSTLFNFSSFPDNLFPSRILNTRIKERRIKIKFFQKILYGSFTGDSGSSGDRLKLCFLLIPGKTIGSLCSVRARSLTL